MDEPLEETINHFMNIFDDEEEETEEINMSLHPYNTRNHPPQNETPSNSHKDKNASSSKNPSNNKE